MNHYEELGLTESASVEEIRQAYKSLARLLHPDHQGEEQLRKVAGLQMRRLNEILAVLTDPLRREKYDASIHPAIATTPAVIDQRMPARWRMQLGRFSFSVGTIVWSASLVVAAVGFSFVLLYFEHGSAVPVYEGSSSQQTRPSPAAMPAKSSKERAAAFPGSERPAERTVKADEVDPPVVAPETPIAAAQKQDPPQDSQLTTPTAPAVTGHDIDKARSDETRTNPNPTIPVVVQVPGPTSPPPGPNALNRTASSRGPLVGTWLYSKSSTDAGTNNNLAYRPEYIEMIVKPDESGKISGRYLGRFQVPDQALSSEVRFAFEGAIGEGTTVLPWRGSDGAEGQVRMKIVSDGAVEVTWYTTRFGTTRKLASGTAVLRRD
jgi:curved DNA-binding protein CbpA